MLLIQIGVEIEILTGHYRTLTAMLKALALTADCNFALTMKGSTVCCNTAPAATGLPIAALTANKTTS
jgi:hypothetical protein